MSRMANLSPLGLYEWDHSVFDLMSIPAALDKETLVNNLLAETAELEVLYPNPVVFKNLVGVWSAKQLDIWNRLYATTQYEYNPIENYNRYETGSQDGESSTIHSGTDTTTDSTAYGGSEGRTEGIMHGGRDTVTENKAEGGTQTDTTVLDSDEGGQDRHTTTSRVANSGTDSTTGTDTKGHWIAGFDSTASGQDDGLVKQTRDQDDATTSTTFGKIEDGTGSSSVIYGKTLDSTDTRTTQFGKTETNSNATDYGKTENVTETKTFGQTIARNGSTTHGEQISTTNDGSHTLHAHGNIGVTSTQQMIREQRSIELFNLYDIIIEDFKMRFCILIY